MTLTHIAVFSALTLLYGLLIPGRWRGWFLMIVSVIAIFWLQPAVSIRRMDFVFPCATLILTLF
ncbi:MAG TPA: hypothetical protein VJZ27_20095, partial [Aggregatilineales bacterium]|nr:hypothetical protein [Aggregatilineales bacterium]